MWPISTRSWRCSAAGGTTATTFWLGPTGDDAAEGVVDQAQLQQVGDQRGQRDDRGERPRWRGRPAGRGRTPAAAPLRHRYGWKIERALVKPSTWGARPSRRKTSAQCCRAAAFSLGGRPPRADVHRQRPDVGEPPLTCALMKPAYLTGRWGVIHAFFEDWANLLYDGGAVVAIGDSNSFPCPRSQT